MRPCPCDTARGVRTSQTLLRAQTSIFALALAGCVTPVMHPFRASDGLFGNGSVSFQLPGGHGCADRRVCASPEEGSAGGLNLVQMSYGYSHVFADRFGVMAGLYFPAWKTHKMGFSWKSLVGLYTFFTVQTDRFSIGAGPEISAGGWGVTTGGEVRPWLTSPWAPALSLYHRWLWPFFPTHEAEDAHAASRELGARIGFGPLFIQYAYHQQLEGVFCYSLIESASCGSAVHIISFGTLGDEEQLGLLSSEEPDQTARRANAAPAAAERPMPRAH
jgi:hypothetical protein